MGKSKQAKEDMAKKQEKEKAIEAKRADFVREARKAGASPLMIAAAQGDYKEVSALAKQDPKAAREEKDALGRTALMHAADGMSSHCIIKLLALGGASLVDRSGIGALERALKAGSVSGAIALAKDLDKEGVLSQIPGLMQLAAEHCAKDDEQGELLKILLPKCRLDSLGSGEATPLMLAARECSEIWVEALAPISDPWALSNSGWIALTSALAGMLSRGLNVRVLNCILDRMESALEPQDGREGMAWAVSQAMARQFQNPELDSRLERMRAIIEKKAIERAAGEPPKKSSGSFAHRL